MKSTENMLKKSYLMRTAAALALAATLASCGGGGSNYTIGGIVYGLQPNTELVLTTNGMEKVVRQTGTADANGNLPPVSYAFDDKLEYGDVYNVVPKIVSTAADGTVTYQRPAHQNCGATGRISDTAGRLSVISADYTCALVTPSIGGVVKGLVAKASLELGNGSDIVTITAPDTQTTPPADLPYTFTVPVTFGKTYGVTVQKQPAGYTCSLQNAAGQITADEAVTNITVTCVANPA